MPTLPPGQQRAGDVVYQAPTGIKLELIGAAPDGTIYVGRWTSASGGFDTDRKASVLALRPDGTLKAGWPSSGIAISDIPLGWVVNDAGTVFIATVQPDEVTDQHTYPVTVTALGSDGKVLPGWPFKTPKAWQPLPLDLEPGPEDSLCFEQARHDILVQTSPAWPTEVYCLGRNGRLLPGWPYSSPTLTFGTAVTSNGTVYLVDAMTPDQPFYRVLALGRDGKPLSGWTATAQTGYLGGAWILLSSPIKPLPNGNVAVLDLPDRMGSAVRILDRSGATVRQIAEAMQAGDGLVYYETAVTDSDSKLYVTARSQTGQLSYVDAFDAEGKALPGWPTQVPSRPTLALAGGGKVWVLSDSSALDAPSITLIDASGKIVSGYPVSADLANSRTLLGYQYFTHPVVGPDGSLYFVALDMSLIVRLS
ncbi:MAG: hypothetical protein ACXWNI_03095 [Candidatus Limnocylindrales bacterium]